MKSLVRHLHRRLADESGVALVVAMGVMMILGILTAVVAASSENVADSSREDRDAKRALGAAEAGLRRANYLLNQRRSAMEGQTITGALGNGTTYEAYVTGLLGTAGNPGLDECAGEVAVDEVSFIPIDQRCVTAWGKSNNTTRRIQIRLGAYQRQALIKVGLEGRDRICIAAPQSVRQPNGPCSDEDLSGGGGGGSAFVQSDVGSNKFIYSNIETCGDMYLGDSDQPPNTTSATSPFPCERVWDPTPSPPGDATDYICNYPPACPAKTFRVDPFALANLDPLFASYNETRCVNIRANVSCARDPDIDTAAGRNDNGAASPDCVAGGPVLDCLQQSMTDAGMDAACIANAYDEATRVLDTTAAGCNGNANAELYLRPGTYNFCGMRFRNNFSFGAQNGVGAKNPATATAANPVVIMIDSSVRSPLGGSGCAAHNTTVSGVRMGTMTMGQSQVIQGSDGDARSLVFFIYGNPLFWGDNNIPSSGTKSIVTVENATGLEAGFFAPSSNLIVKNSGTSGTTGLHGAFQARELDIGQGFNFREEVRYRESNIPIIAGLNYRTAWVECKPSDNAASTGCS